MQLKAVFPEKRSRPIEGLDLAELKELAGRAERVLWFNRSDFLSEVSSRDFLRRLKAMPEGSKVVLMWRNNHSARAFPVLPGCEFKDGVLVLTTSCMA
jgi:hypothetical protein